MSPIIYCIILSKLYLTKTFFYFTTKFFRQFQTNKNYSDLLLQLAALILCAKYERSSFKCKMAGRWYIIEKRCRWTAGPQHRTLPDQTIELWLSDNRDMTAT